MILLGTCVNHAGSRWTVDAVIYRHKDAERYYMLSRPGAVALLPAVVLEPAPNAKKVS